MVRYRCSSDYERNTTILLARDTSMTSSVSRTELKERPEKRVSSPVCTFGRLNINMGKLVPKDRGIEIKLMPMSQWHSAIGQ